MFKPQRMKQVSFLVMENQADSALESLQQLGVLHLVSLAEQDGFSSFDRASETDKLEEITLSSSRLSKLVELFVSTEKKGSPLSKLKQLMRAAKPPELGSPDLEKNLTNSQELLEKIERPCLALDQRLKTLREQEGKIREKIALLKKIDDFTFDLSLLGDSRYLSVVVGEISRSNFLQLQQKLPNDTEIILRKELPDDDSIILLLLSLKSERFYDTLRETYFETFELSGEKGTPCDLITSYQQQLSNTCAEQLDTLSRIVKLSRKWKDQLEKSRWLLEIYKDRQEAISNFVRTETTYLVRGYVPVAQVNSLLSQLNDYRYCHLVELKDPVPGEDIPTSLANNRVVKPFETITKLYGLPRYNEIDPTFLIFLAFPFFFAICLTDAGYGFILLLASLFVYWLYRHQESGIRDFSYILILSALFTIVLGIVTGGIFGPLTLGGEAIGNPFLGLLGDYQLPILLDLFDRAKIALGLALGLGWFHLLLGFGINAFSKYKEGNFRGMIENLNWASLEFILGLGTLLLLKYFMIPTPLLHLILAIFAVNLVLMLYLTGPMGIMNISGTFGNILSYARLFALAMATASIGLAINVMAGEISKIAVFGIGAILAPLFLIGGHLFSLVINTMGAVIHPLRLHYVEFFSKFYQGGGIEYAPLKFKQKT